MLAWQKNKKKNNNKKKEKKGTTFNLSTYLQERKAGSDEPREEALHGVVRGDAAGSALNVGELCLISNLISGMIVLKLTGELDPFSDACLPDLAIGRLVLTLYTRTARSKADRLPE